MQSSRDGEGQIVFQCQAGPDECFGNRAQGCMLSRLPNQDAVRNHCSVVKKIFKNLFLTFSKWLTSLAKCKLDRTALIRLASKNKDICGITFWSAHRTTSESNNSSDSNRSLVRLTFKLSINLLMKLLLSPFFSPSNCTIRLDPNSRLQRKNHCQLSHRNRSSNP